MSETPTLRHLLTAQRAQSLLEVSPTPASGAEPTHAELRAALAQARKPDLDSAKLDLLAATFASADIQQSALTMTPAQAARALSPSSRHARSKSAAGQESDGLTVAGLDELPSGAWEDCARWLAEQAGYAVEERPLFQRDALLAWRGQRQGKLGGRAVVCAMRLPQGAPLLESDLRRLHTIATNEQDAELLAVTTAEATIGARVLARELGVHLLDKEDLERTLARLATAFARERAQTQNDTKAQAKAAAAARKKLLAALTAAETQSKAAPPARRAAGRPAVKKAVEQAREARLLAAQALLAWETLVTEWGATFGERPARDGSLIFSAEAGAYTELGARAEHLKKPLLDAIRGLVKTPGDGELGYGAWRQALVEEAAARCSALLWRATMIDPAQWQDYTAAMNDNAAREASLADNAATHAAARATRAHSQMTERAGAL